jgi:CyaY protein
MCRYEIQVDKAFKDIADRVDELDHDELDISESDGKLVIEADDGTPFIVNRQSAANQIWFAEPGGGWHFDYRQDQWLCDKRGMTLIAAIEAALSKKFGQKISL